MAEEERRDLRRYLHRALEVWSKQGKLTQPLVRTVCSHTANKHEKVSRAFLGGYLELYMYMYLSSPLYNIQYVHVCTMHVHTYYMYIHTHTYTYTCTHILHIYYIYIICIYCTCTTHVQVVWVCRHIHGFVYNFFAWGGLSPTISCIQNVHHSLHPGYGL